MCTTDLGLSVGKLQKEKKMEQCLCAEVSVYVVYILSTVKTENTHKKDHSNHEISILFEYHFKR